MTRESVLRYVQVCSKCHASYIPQNGEVCNCPEVDPDQFEDVMEARDYVEQHTSADD